MNSTTIIWLSAAVLGIALAIYVRSRFRFWKGEAKKLLEGGYLPAPPTLAARLFFKLLTRLAVFLIVGPVKVKGRSNARYKGRLLLAPNHTFALDFAVVRTAVPTHYVQIAKAAEVQGVRAILAAWVGTIAAKVEGGIAAKPGQGAAVVTAAANYLASGSHARLLMFPQGKLVYDNVLRPEDFRTGAIRSLTLARENMLADETTRADADDMALLPMALHYKRDPRHASLFHKLVNGMGKIIPPLRKFRRWVDVTRNPDGTKTKTVFTNYGATVIIGEPIPLSSLPSDPHEATEFVRLKIQELLTQAEKA